MSSWPESSVEQRINAEIRERVHQPVARRGANLNEADLFRIGVQTVRLRVHGDPIRRAHHGQEGRQLLFCVNHARRGVAKAGREVKKFPVKAGLKPGRTLVDDALPACGQARLADNFSAHEFTHCVQ